MSGERFVSKPSTTLSMMRHFSLCSLSCLLPPPLVPGKSQRVRKGQGVKSPNKRSAESSLPLATDPEILGQNAEERMHR